MTENIKVVVRVRPALGDEAQGGEAHAVQLAEPAAEGDAPRASLRGLRVDGRNGKTFTANLQGVTVHT